MRRSARAIAIFAVLGTQPLACSAVLGIHDFGPPAGDASVSSDGVSPDSVSSDRLASDGSPGGDAARDVVPSSDADAGDEARDASGPSEGGDGATCPSTVCSSCPDYASCARCYFGVHPDAAAAYLALIQCLACRTCATSCAASANGLCQGSPPAQRPCDSDSASADACNGCLACDNQSGQCLNETLGCQDPDCVQLFTDIHNNCPPFVGD